MRVTVPRRRAAGNDAASRSAYFTAQQTRSGSVLTRAETLVFAD
jgi:hypothetical protein